MFNAIRSAVRRLLKHISDVRNGRVYYVVRISDPENGERVEGCAICDCEVFGGIRDFGLFKYKGSAWEFASWREFDAHYATGYVYYVDRATDAEVDEYLNYTNAAQGQ